MSQLRLIAALTLAPYCVALAQSSSACRGEPTRSAVIGGVAGSALVLAIALRSDQDRHITADERLPYIWGATWGAVIGSGVGRITARAHCPDVMPQKLPMTSTASDCQRAAWSGSAKGAMGGALAGFLVAPILALVPAAGAAVSGQRIDFNQTVGIATVVSAAAGAPIGAYRAYADCRTGS